MELGVGARGGPAIMPEIVISQLNHRNINLKTLRYAIWWLAAEDLSHTNDLQLNHLLEQSGGGGTPARLRRGSAHHH